jgi:hypothetical protein
MRNLNQWRKAASPLALLAVIFAVGRPILPQEPEVESEHERAFRQPMAQPEFRAEVKHDVSPPLRSIVPIRPPAGTLAIRTLGPVHPGRRYPRVVDRVRQTQLAKVPSRMLPVTSGLGFAGVGQGDYGFTVNVAPPDTNGAVGDTQYVQWVNLSFAVFNKSNGALVYGPAAGNTLWSGFGGPCQSDNNGDPIALYDKNAHRWIMGQFAISGGPPYYECIAVSATSDATGQWYRYQLQSTLFDDYPKIGVWPDAYYFSFNLFSGNTFQGSSACAFDRNAMLAGQAASSICTSVDAPLGGFLPSDWDGSTPPPAGTPNFYLEWDSSTLLNMWRFHVDFTNPANSTFSGPTGITVASFSPACGGSTCIPQPGTTNLLDSLADRLMYRLAYRHYADHESLVTNHSVGSPSGIRWYEIRDPNGSPTVYQQGTYSPDSNYRWMGSVAMDQVGDLAVGYSESNSTTLHPSIYYTGRVPGDTLGALEPETSVLTGVGAQTGTLHRWGDYSALNIDPADDCTFWYTNEYLKADGNWNWSTYINSFKFNSCKGYQVTGTTPAPVNPGQSASIPLNVNPTGGFSGTVNLTASGYPAGVTPSFDHSSVSPPGSATLTIPTTTSTPAGTYNVVVTGTSGVISQSAQILMVVNGGLQVSLTPAAGLAFPHQVVGTTSSSQPITVNVSGNSSMSVNGISTTGDFAQTNTCGTGVPSGGNCQVSVTFNPTGIGPRKGLLSLDDNASGSPQRIVLTGVGTAVNLSTGIVSFGSQTVGTSSASQQVTITNKYSTPVHLWQIAITGANAGDFSKTTTCGSTLAAGANCSVSVTFKPTATGLRSASLMFSNDGGGSPQAVTLTGSGT